MATNEVPTITSRELAELTNKQHTHVLKDIRKYAEMMKELNGAGLCSVDYFIESMYIDNKGEHRPCFRITRKGCEFFANKMQGSKGAEFTTKYIERFHQMENQIASTTSKDLRTLTSAVDRMNEKLTQALDHVTLNTKKVQTLTKHLKQRLSEKYGYTIKAKDPLYIRAKHKLFYRFSVRKWEEITVSQYNEVHAEIDGLYFL